MTFQVRYKLGSDSFARTQTIEQLIDTVRRLRGNGEVSLAIQGPAGLIPPGDGPARRPGRPKAAPANAG